MKKWLGKCEGIGRPIVNEHLSIEHYFSRLTADFSGKLKNIFAAEFYVQLLDVVNRGD